ncbi:MAG: hypothetical protein ACRC36_14215 [Lacrimispora sphenoides]
MSKFKDITGMRFGRLVALGPTDKRLCRNVVWKCQCECGNICYVAVHCLQSGGTKSCGCSRIDDLSGKKIGMLKVIKMVRKDGKDTYWECMCDCGKKTVVTAGNLKSGHTKSCGCLHKNVCRQKIQRDMLNEKSRMKMIDTVGLIDGTMIAMLNDKPPLTNKSGVRGVFWDSSREKWGAVIKFKGKQYYLGRYEKKEDAIRARKEAEDELWKPFIEEHCKGREPK